ncbi:MAG: exopolysaccharide biosynthesis protein [Lachnospiraceae bacterium]|nr:exopolysaccharide biosynthesis protein [Lachnospiraceae bacterium]
MSERLDLVDLHTHILPGVDDGSSSMQETLEMVDLAYREGVRTIIATSHFDHERSYGIYPYREIFAKVQQEVAKSHPDMQLYLGSEILYTYGVLDDLASGDALTIEDTKYILVEFYPDEHYSEVFGAFQKLRRSGYKPILAHVERVDCLWKQWDRMDELKSMHILFQMNTESIIGSVFNGPVRYCRKLIKEGYIDFMGTDMHNKKSRAPVYREAAAWIEKECGREVCEDICRNHALAVVEGKRLA